jgi:hypothetical protein
VGRAVEDVAQEVGLSKTELGQEASNIGPLPQTPIPANSGDGKTEVCRILM